jgi:hypothetical protein
LTGDIVAGRGDGTLDAGAFIRYPDEMPIANLYVAMLDRVGVKVESIGDSTGEVNWDTNRVRHGS